MKREKGGKKKKRNKKKEIHTDVNFEYSESERDSTDEFPNRKSCLVTVARFS